MSSQDYRREHKGCLSIEEIVHVLIPLCEEFGIAKAFLFGSYARGEANSASDVDILIEKGKTKGVEVLDFRELLSERLGKPVDIVTTAGASDRFLSKIMCDEVLLYDATSGADIFDSAYKSTLERIEDEIDLKVWDEAKAELEADSATFSAEEIAKKYL